MAVQDIRLAVVVPERNVASETFINAHIEGLFRDPSVVWGSPRPIFVAGTESVLTGAWKTVASVIGFVLRVDPTRAHGAIGRRLSAATYSRVLAGYLRRTGVEVVLAEYGPTAVSILDACSVSRTPLVVHFHGYDAYQRDVLVEFKEAYQRMFHAASRVVAVSRDMVEQLIGLGCPADRVLLNSCGVDVNRFDGARPGEAEPLLLALGRFVEKKGPLLTLQAFAQVERAEPGARLVMLGEGPLRDRCVDLARDLAVDEKIEFPGTVDHREAAAWMRKARCFVQHSLQAEDGDSEGTPVAVLEASSSGLPVVSTKHGGIPDAVVDGVSGFLVDEGDVDAMARQILRLVRDARLADEMGVAGREHILAHYSLEGSLGRLRDVLAAAASRGP